MRIKVTPADFRVTELLDFEPSPSGRHFVHRLRKQKLSTQEALAAIVQHAGIDRAAVAYAGLKDRQAVTEQFISIDGHRLDLQQANWSLTCVGRSERPIQSKLSRGNSFEIVVRDLAPVEAARVRRDLPSVVRTGFPNYFDDQRFGCLRHGQGFVMVQVLRGDYEAALRALVAEPSPVAISGDVKLKRALMHHWGDWDACMRIARGPVYRPVFERLLADPGDFRGALAALPTRMKLIHSFAYQSFLWNRAVSRMIKPMVPGVQRLKIDTLAGWLLAWRYLDREVEERLSAMSTPLYAPDGDGGAPQFRAGMAEEMANAGVARQDFLQHEVAGMVWKEEPRAVLVKPADAAPPDLAADELHPDRMRVTLRFSLPRGSYATMLLKRLFAQPWEMRRPDPRGADRPRRARPPSPRVPADEDFDE